MINPDVFVDAVRDKLKAIPAVATLVGSASKITSYQDGGDTLSEAVSTMESSTLLVAWLESEPSGPNDLSQWIHKLGIFLRVNARLGSVFTTICNGIATGGDGLKFTETDIHADFEQLGVPQFTRGQDDEGMEYPRIEMRFRQRSQE